MRREAVREACAVRGRLSGLSSKYFRPSRTFNKYTMTQMRHNIRGVSNGDKPVWSREVTRPSHHPLMGCDSVFQKRGFPRGRSRV